MSPKVEFRVEQQILDSFLEAYVRLAVLKDPQTGELCGYRVVEMNSQAAHISGRRREDALGRDVCEVFAMDRDCWQRLQERLQEPEGPRTFDFYFQRVDRRFLISPVHLSADEILLFFAEVTYRAKAEDAFRIHEVLFHYAQDIILYIDMSGQVVNANEKACEAYGYTKDQLKQLRIQDIRHPSTQAVFEGQMEKADTGGVVFECVHLRSDGSAFPVEVSARSTETGKGKIRIHIIRDITERKEQEGRIAWLARHDGLTGVLNRMSFIGELELEIHRAQRSASRFAVLLFDIDKFKLINDSFGHVAGDFVLGHVATSVRSVLRQNDQLGRFGGDEFVVLQTGIEGPADVLSLAQRMTEVLKMPVSYAGAEISLSISLGASLYPEDATNIPNLLHFADQAMYHTKRKGGNGYDLYRSLMIL